MNFFVIFTVFVLLSSYCMIMWNHSINIMDSVVLKQNYEQKYYLCSALLDYGVNFYRSEQNLLDISGEKIFKNWPNYNNTYSGKISWEKTDKTVIIKAELINKSENKTEFSLTTNLIIQSQN